MNQKPWSNQDIVLYHGTTRSSAAAILGRIDLTHSRPASDFGPGFYTTTNLIQAREWAAQTTRRQHSGSSAIVRFTIPRDGLATLDTLWFVLGSKDADDYWSFVSHCRRNLGWSGSFGHGRTMNAGWYDVVVGPVARAWRQRVSYSRYDQVSFHTPKSLAVLGRARKAIL